MLENHDATRVVTRLGEREAGAAALLLLALPGPVFLYQGQELGLEEVALADEVRQDPIFKRTGGKQLGRDGSRVRLPWSREPPAAAGCRRRPGGARMAPSPAGTLGYDRDELACVVNFSAPGVSLGDVVLASEPVGATLPARTAARVPHARKALAEASADGEGVDSAPVRTPAEWEPHERTIMGWPCRLDLWGDTVGQARSDYAAVANAVAAFEPVTMIANPGADAAGARAACSAAVEIAELGLDDSWLRDCGPIYTVDDHGHRVAVHFAFNAWGEKFPPWDRDAAVGRLIAERLGDRVVESAMVLEGGSILTDGEGTLLTTEQCLLNVNRNPSLSREAIESEMRARLGVQRVVWLGMGLLEDRDTDGHVDLVAAFTRPGHVLLQTVREDNPNFVNCAENRARLEAAGIEVTELGLLPYAEVAGQAIAASYLNFYICNGAVIVPVAGADTDEQALEVIAAAYPAREVIPVPGLVIAYGGGGPHCITQQVPVAP